MSRLRTFLASLGTTEASPATGPAAVLVRGGAPDAWRASWAWSPPTGGPGLTVRLFRCEFDAAAGGHEPFLIHVSADARYRLWLNGRRVGFGPAKGTLGRYQFETYDLTRLLQARGNVLAAEVRWFGVNSPASEVHSPVPGFLVQGPTGAGVDTPGSWRVWEASAVTPDTTSYIGNAQTFLNHMERVDLAREPVGWREPGFAPGGWPAAVAVGPAAAFEATWGVAPLRTLTPRNIAALLETPGRFGRTIEARRERSHLFGSSPKGWSLPAGEGGVIVLDPGEYVTGFPELELIGGAGRELRVTYAEALGEWVELNGHREWRKAPVRDDFTRYDVHGYRDTLLLDGREVTWEPFYWRAFRFIQLEILPGPAVVTVRDARYRLCVYPQDFAARVETSDHDSARIFDISVRTFRVGAHEIYDDSPYYEQFSYIADSRLEALASLHLCNDPSLPRRVLGLFLETLRPDGLIDSRVPCQYVRQTIPFFCLHWILMLDDYWRWQGPDDLGFVRECLVAVDPILNFFRARLRPDGFVGPVGGWNMVDDVAGWPNGEPPAITHGGSTYLTSLFVEALQTAARLHGQAGEPGDAVRWINLADRIAAAVRREGWDDAAGLYREQAGDSAGPYSQHAQAAVINAGIATPAQIDRIVSRLCTDAQLLRTKSMQAFYVARALEQAGRFDLWHQHVLQPWRDWLQQRVTTWPEYPDPSRSDSHAWAAWPGVEYVRTVLGVRPAAPGWRGLRLAPQVGGLDWAQGEAPTPRGVVRVEWRKSAGRLRFHAEAPAGLLTQLALPGQPVQSYPAGGSIDAEVPLAGRG